MHMSCTVVILTTDTPIFSPVPPEDVETSPIGLLELVISGRRGPKEYTNFIIRLSISREFQLSRGFGSANE